MPEIGVGTQPLVWDPSIIVHWLLLVVRAFGGQPWVVSQRSPVSRMFAREYTVLGSLDQASRLIKNAERTVTCGTVKPDQPVAI